MAYGVLEVAKAAMKLSGAVVSSILKSVAYIINAATQVLWIKSFELGISVTPQIQMIHADLVLTILGNDVRLGGELDLSGLVENIKNFVSGGVKEKSDKLIEDMKAGKLSRAIEVTPDSQIDLALVSEYCNLNKNKRKYEELLYLRDVADDFNNAYFDTMNEEDPGMREAACYLMKLRWEEEIFHEQHSDAFDDKFVRSLKKVVKAIRKDKKSSRANISNEMESKMGHLLYAVKSIKDKKEDRVKRAKEKDSLFARVEQNIVIKRNSMRRRAAKVEVSAEEANEIYANKLSLLIDQHLGNCQGKEADDLKKILDESLLCFRNHEDSIG